jgi:hypothetical protein
MKLLKIKLLVIAAIMLAASSAFASFSYNVSIDTSGISASDGYLYFQYLPVNATNSTATVSNFSTDGVLASAPSTLVADGSAVSGALPGSLVFANTNGVNDYNHGITFGNNVSFLLSFSNPAPGGQFGGSSTFSLGRYLDEAGTSGSTLFTIDLNNDGTTTVQTLANEARVAPTPLPAAALLFGSGILGLAGLRRKKPSNG